MSVLPYSNITTCDVIKNICRVHGDFDSLTNEEDLHPPSLISQSGHHPEAVPNY